MLTGPDDPNRLDRVCVGLAAALQMHCLLAPWVANAAPPLAGKPGHGVVTHQLNRSPAYWQNREAAFPRTQPNRHSKNQP